MIAFNRPTLVTITAPTCSGKSYLLNELTKRGVFNRIVSTTTRSQRPGETSGVDYDYISHEKSLQMEADDEFFELIEFNGIRYGVTEAEMGRAMTSVQPPVVILEPQGLQIYSEKCAARGWGIFKIYVHVAESVRLDRLLNRSVDTAWDVIDTVNPTPGRYSQTFLEVAGEKAKAAMARVLTEHQRRVLSITGDERLWQGRFNWDVIVPGDNVDTAIKMIDQGIKWHNRRTGEPQAFGGKVDLPQL